MRDRSLKSWKNRSHFMGSTSSTLCGRAHILTLKNTPIAVGAGDFTLDSPRYSVHDL